LTALARTVLDALFERTFHRHDLKAVQLLLEAGHPPTLLSAAASGDVELLRKLSGDDLQTLDRAYTGNGIRPLHAAVLGEQLGAVKWLVERGVDLNASNHGGQGKVPVDTPLMEALSHNNTEIAILLINLGADVNQKGSHGKYPVNVVIAWGRSPKILEALLAHQANLSFTYQKKTVRELVRDSKSKNRERYLELLGVGKVD
jgi:ankyrin repeat protein